MTTQSSSSPHPERSAGFDVDTAHFTGNYPPACRIDACNSTSEPDETTKWTEVLGLSQFGPSAHHFFTCASNDVWTHVRLHIHPDGGVARLRVYGQPSLDTNVNGEAVDLASSLLVAASSPCPTPTMVFNACLHRAEASIWVTVGKHAVAVNRAMIGSS